MVTGDHLETAKTIARKTGLIENEKAVALHGNQLSESMLKDDSEIKKVFESSIFARVSPAQKLDLVTAYQEKGFIVGMTGDGINDTPALKKADIGIAMGTRGTEAAKEVADLVLEDDSFASIVMAIKQGRGIFQNIQHFVVYLLSCNLSELLVVAFAFLSNAATPLLPLQILFLNMVTDVFPALALGMNKESDNVMDRAPRKIGESIINANLWISIVVYALCISASVLGLMFYAIYLGLDQQTANNLTFYALVLTQLVHVFNLSHRKQSFFINQVTTNKYIWMAILLCLVITFFVYYQPTMQQVLSLQDIGFNEFLLVIPFGFLPVLLIQVLKRLRIIE
jgi:Ca2+-transporting ATPase